MNPEGNRRDFIVRSALAAASLSALPAAAAAPSSSPKKVFKIPRCRVTPLARHETAIELNGHEATRWHFGGEHPRPFFFPFNGPSGAALTRMGHPGAPDHDHHRSIWFAHHDVDGVSFWADNSKARIRQKGWLCYEDGDAQCAMAVRLGWFAGEPEREAIEQTLVAIARPLKHGEHTLELQSAFRAVSGPVRLGKTNFGFLAVRVAKSISEFFGGGRLTDSEGRVGEPAIFGQRATWMDYSGAVAEGVVEGITYFDHPENPGAPTHWHVRQDGWMGAAFNLNEARVLLPDQPLRLRYLLHAHRGAVKRENANHLLASFSRGPFHEVVPLKGGHRQFELRPALQQ